MAKKSKSYKCKNGERCAISAVCADEYHHITSRGSGGPDESWNMIPLSRERHTELEQIGRTTFAETYSAFKLFLLSHDWYFCELTEKWRHAR